jgi:hypothetical protein
MAKQLSEGNHKFPAIFWRVLDVAGTVSRCKIAFLEHFSRDLLCQQAKGQYFCSAISLKSSEKGMYRNQELANSIS